MFVRQNQQQFRNSNADVQIFYGQQNALTTSTTWNKPPGVSHVYMLLVGPGGDGNGTTGGGSGAVTVWYGAAQNVPDALNVYFISGDTNVYDARDTTPSRSLVTAKGATGLSTSGGSATSANAFAASGFYQSIAGQSGSSGAVSASTTTFLSGGGASGVTANYGYSIALQRNGFFMLQPIIVGVGGSSSGLITDGGIGCGGSAVGGKGGPGMVLIASW